MREDLFFILIKARNYILHIIDFFMLTFPNLCAFKYKTCLIVFTHVLAIGFLFFMLFSYLFFLNYVLYVLRSYSICGFELRPQL